MNYKIIKENKHKYLEFDILNELGVTNAITIRDDIYYSYDEVCEDLDLDKTKICKITKQIHSNIVFSINENYDVSEGDALITNKKNTPLFIRTSDCNSIVIYDKVKKVIACIHSGWRGTVKRILINTINEMIEKYSSCVSDLIVCFYPSIRECHFEVDTDVYELFKSEFKEYNESLYIKVKELENKYLIDTTLLNILMLKDMGIKEKNIYTTDLCTYHNNDLFYSYRKKDKNNNLTVVVMKGK